MKYYQKTIFIPKINKHGKIIGQVERWEAHQKGILHNGFTVAVFFKEMIICQHRKHPVFNGYLDFTASSHPIYENTKLKTDRESIVSTLKREWNIKEKELISPIKFEKKIIYKSFDGQYTEHEQCYFYSTRIDKIPTLNSKFSYGYSLLTFAQIKSFPSLKSIVAPWVKKILKKR